METQWPRYYVFEKPRPEAAYIHAGSVHAPDPEMALLIARDVFARRPARTAMWVVPADSIYSRTTEELAAGEGPETSLESEKMVFQVFTKNSQKGVCIHRGSVKANGLQAALAAALQSLPDPRALVWWLVPESTITRSDPGEENLLYGSSPGKEFRHESHYPVRTMMREIMARAKKAQHDETDS